MIQLIKGDCLIEMQNIPDKSIDAIICDLPYGATVCKWDTVIPFDPLWKQYNRIIKKDGAIVLFGNEPFSSTLRMSNIKNYKYDFYWNKTTSANFAHCKNMPINLIENIIVFSLSKIKHKTQQNRMIYNPQGVKKSDRVFSGSNSMKKSEHCMMREGFFDGRKYDGKGYPINLLKYNNSSSKDRGLHPTQKPILLMEYLIRTYTNENDTILDNTMGSGTTGIACQNTKRNFIGIEMDENYFKIAQKRIEENKYKLF